MPHPRYSGEEIERHGEFGYNAVFAIGGTLVRITEAAS